MVENRQEFEIIKHPRIDNINLFFVNLINRSTHLHGDMEFVFVLEGALIIRSRSGEYAAGRGSLHFFNSNEPHSLRRREGNTVLLSLQISRKLFRGLFPALETVNFRGGNILESLTQESRREILSTLSKVAGEYFRGGFAFELPLTSGILSLFSRMISQGEYTLIDREELNRNRERCLRLSRLTAYIEDNLTERITLTDLAEMESLSPTYVSHFFRDNFDITFQEYLSDRRFGRAEKLMRETNLPLLDICLESGFSDRKYMNKAFLRNCGCSAKEYRLSAGTNRESVLRDRNRTDPLTSQYIIRRDGEIDRWLERLERIAEPWAAY